MTIGTSLGGHYQDEHHYQAREFQSDIQRSVNKAVEGLNWDLDADIIRNPIETSSGNTSPLDEMGTKEMQMGKSSGEDPGNIYNDSGEVVDYDFKQGDPWGKGDLPTEALKEYRGYIPKFNELDALADRKTDEQIRKDNEELNK